MNKKAIATQAIIILGVFFFTIAITSGTLFLFDLTGDSKKQSIELEVDKINYGTFLLNYLRAPAIIDGKETNRAELIIYAINNDTQLIEGSLQEIKPFFWKINISGKGVTDVIIYGDLNESMGPKIHQEQFIPNYFGGSPNYYKISLIGGIMR